MPSFMSFKASSTLLSPAWAASRFRQQRRLTAKGEDRCVLLDGRFHHGYGQRFDEGRIVLGKFMIGPVGSASATGNTGTMPTLIPGSA